MKDWQTQTRKTVDAGYGSVPTPEFASPTAEQEWKDAGSPAGLLETEPSGDTGYTASDVRAYLASEEE